MSEESDDQEKTEPATLRRLEKAREEGQVARSRELTTFLLLGGGLLGLWAMGSKLSRQLGMVMEQAFLFDRTQAFDLHVTMSRVFELGSHSLLAIAPLLLGLVVMALISPLLLGGWSMSSKAMAPKLSKLNPIQGFKRMLSAQMWTELGKAIVKSLLIGGVAVWFLMRHRGDLIALMGEPVMQAIPHALKLAASASGLMVLALLVVVGIDVPWQLFSHAKKLRMTKEEVRRENKETEGDPHVKGRIRSQQQAMARGRMMSKVPEADVIVTNPTHYAVALRYDEKKMGAPRVVAKGAGEIAARIRELGREHHVPLLEAPPLARALYRHVDLDREIPGPLYNAVAEVLVWAMRLKRAHVDGATPPPEPIDLPVPEGMDKIDTDTTDTGDNA
ncbi:MAG TPA: flagellar biosynthesis protein FlhB [Rhodanobacteraceae bacterium]|nr:flagellar biosynthesis protein FlhB [Rhodanobacteraceae bacterium]